MEGKKSFVDELFPRSEAAQQPKSDILRSIFPPHPAGAGKNSLLSDWSGSCRKQGAEGQISNSNSRERKRKMQSSAKKNSDPVYLCELPEPCLLSSSVYYGGRDDFIPESSSTKNSEAQYNRKDKADDSGNTDVATRGDWWQGSFYY